MKIIEHFSSNFDERGNAPIDMLVLHYTGMPTAQTALERLCDATPGKRVSAHYLVDEGGTLYRLVPEEKAAWHAGKSYWRGHTDINARSIGIEIANPGHEYGYRPFPQAQMGAVAEICREILARHAIPARNVVAHSDIAPIRKEDPGELFDWQWLAAQGIGRWPDHALSLPLSRSRLGEAFGFSRRRSQVREREAALSAAGEGEALAQYGYDVTDLPKAILAFQRHFRPKSLTGAWDGECERLLASLLQSA